MAGQRQHPFNSTPFHRLTPWQKAGRVAVDGALAGTVWGGFGRFVLTIKGVIR